MDRSYEDTNTPILRQAFGATGMHMITTYLRTLCPFNRDVRLYMVTLGLIGFSYFGITSVLLYN